MTTTPYVPTQAAVEAAAERLFRMALANMPGEQLWSNAPEHVRRNYRERVLPLLSAAGGVIAGNARAEVLTELSARVDALESPPALLQEAPDDYAEGYRSGRSATVRLVGSEIETLRRAE